MIRFVTEPQSVEIVSATLPEAHEDIVSVYRSAFSLPPHFEDERDVERFRHELDDYANREGFRLLVSRHKGKTVGFTYGFMSAKDGWTRSVVAPLMEESEADFWFSDCFELADLAVVPEAHGRGVGGRLHDDLLVGISNRTAMLFVNRKAAPALSLYRGRGWVTLVEEYRRPNSEKRFEVMGLRL